MKKLNVVYCGTPDFSVPTLELLANHPQINLIKVITMPDRKAGRGQKLIAPPVAQFAREMRLPLFQTENINHEEDLLQELENTNVDFILVLAFAQFLGKRVLDLPKIGCFNIHTSLLPKYRGAAPIQYALLNGDQETGVSIQKMVKKMDAGDLVHSFPMPVGSHETGGQLYTRLKFQAALSTSTLIDQILIGSLEATPQDEQFVSFAPTLKKKDGFLNFEQLSATEIFNRVRALIPWPGSYCFIGEKRVKVLSVEYSNQKLKPGELSTQFQALHIGCREGSIHLTTVQCEGKKVCTDFELLNGLKNCSIDLVVNPKGGQS